MNDQRRLTMLGIVSAAEHHAARTEEGDATAPVDEQSLGRHRKVSSLRRGLVRPHRIKHGVFGNHDRDPDYQALQPDVNHRRSGLKKLTLIMAIGAVVVIVAAISLIVVLLGGSAGNSSADPGDPASGVPTLAPGSYLGVYEPGAPESYTRVRAFGAATGVRPNLVVYYSGWLEKFQVRFATVATRQGATPLVQINPEGVSLKTIASGHYDAYLHSYASAVKTFGHHVIISFGHEMNGSWYSWGYRHTSPSVFIAAWRHIVTVFRRENADNVSWLWTINISECRCHIDSPAPWWPGSSYVNWVGIDGYYYQPSWKFASLFGPTIKAVRALTLDPILISETAAPAAIQPAKIPDLFRGIRAYGLLGFIWFDVNKGHPYEDWQISSPTAFAAFHRGAGMLEKSES